jgi:hypothetical protein
MPFVIRPRTMTVTIDGTEETDDERRNAAITVTTNVLIGREQRVVLALNEFSLASPTAYMFDIPRREADAHQVVIPVQEVEPGESIWSVCSLMGRKAN